MAASAWRRKATASGGRSRMSEPQKWWTTPLPRRRAMRSSTCARQERLPEVVVEDVELAQRPRERPHLAGQVARQAEHAPAADEVEVAVVAAHERPLVEHQQGALVAERAQPRRDRAGAAGDVDRRVQDARAALSHGRRRGARPARRRGRRSRGPARPRAATRTAAAPARDRRRRAPRASPTRRSRVPRRRRCPGTW